MYTPVFVYDVLYLLVPIKLGTWEKHLG